MVALAKDDKTGMAAAPGASAPLGVYVHFPWCLKKCPYCDFLSLPSDPGHIPHHAYAERVVLELGARARELQAVAPRLRSIFVGGGTPSLWDPSAVAHVLANIRQRFGADEAPAVEVTAECNPTSLTQERAHQLKRAGVNRLSIGVQSLDSARLEFLGRWHSPEQGLQAIEHALEAGFERVSADLIYGIHGQSPEAAAGEAERLAATGITHLSAYTLTIEKGTVFGARAQKGKLPLLGEEAVADGFLAMHAALEGLGFEHYEISNFARGGHYAEHNLGYWRGDDYLGLGTGAWGTIQTRAGRQRYRNTPSPERYLEASAGFETLERDHGRGLVQQLEPIDAETALRERLLLGLRLRQGFDLEASASELGVDPWPVARRRAADRLLARGRLRAAGGQLSIPADQWLLADDTICSLL